MILKGWRVQRPVGNYWLFGAWGDRTEGWSAYPDASVTQITLGLGPWKIQFVKVKT